MMADGTKIEWTDATLNVVNGCSVISPGCTNCFAMRSGGRNLPGHPSTGLTQPSKAGHVWTGEIRFNETALLQPLRWRRGRRIFWNAHGDLFHENVPDACIDRCFAVMALTPQHQHQVLTKRSARMRRYCSDPRTPARIARAILDMVVAGTAKIVEPWPVQTIGDIDAPSDVTVAWPLPNVWLGVSVEDQQRADERIPDLLATPAAVRFLSCEPLLGPVDLRWIAEPDEEKDGVIDALLGCNWVEVPGDDFQPARPGHQDRRMGRWVVSGDDHILANRKLDWVIVGGESGKGARPMHPDWARSLRDQCAAAGVPFHFKQWGLFTPSGPGAHPVDYRDCAGAVAWPDGVVTLQGGDPAEHGGAGQHMYRATKAIAGRLLDGVQHDGTPG